MQTIYLMAQAVKKKIIIGTRESKLALAQTDEVRKAILKYFPDTEFEIKTIKTSGDRFLQEDLSKIGGKVLFIKEIEEDLINGAIDIAVHSMKDMPVALPKGLIMPAILKRKDHHDVFVSNKYPDLKSILKGL